MNGKSLRPAGSEVRVRLGGLAESRLELAAERRQRRVRVVERLQDECRPTLDLAKYAWHVRHAGERQRSPGECGRVVRRSEPFGRLDEPEAGKAEPTRGQRSLDVCEREQVVEASRLVAGDGKRLALPDPREEVLGLDRLQAALERGGPV